MRRATVGTAVGALLLGGALTTVSAGPASAATPAGVSAADKCNPAKVKVYPTQTVHLRSAASSGSASKGLVAKGTDLYAACTTGKWIYVKALEGRNKGKKGWVADAYIKVK